MKLNNIKIILSISLIFLIISPASTSSLTEHQDTLDINQTTPLLQTSDLKLSIELPLSGSEVIVQGYVTNNDNQSYTNIRVVISVLLLSNHPEDGKSLQEVGSKIIANIDPLESVEFLITIVLDAGGYTLSSTIFYNNFSINTSTTTITILVLSPPEGDIPTILIGLLLIIGFLVMATITPTLYDKYRVDKAFKRQKATKSIKPNC